MGRRGSALSYVIVMVFAITSVVIASTRVSSQTESEFNGRYNEARFKSLADGAVAEAIADAHKGTLATGSRSTTISGVTLSTRVTQNSRFDQAFDLEVSALIGDRTYKVTQTIGKRRPNPVFYAVWSGGDHLDNTFSTTVNGSIYVGGAATFTGVTAVENDMLTRNTPSLAANTVGGHLISGARAQTIVTVPATLYPPLGTEIPASRVANLTFSGLDSAGLYPVQFRNGNLNLSGGTLSGKGTVYVSGNLIIEGNLNYATADSRVLFIIGGNLRVQNTVASMVGSYFAIGRNNLLPTNLAVLRGNLIAGDRIERSGTLNVTQDNGLLSRDEAMKHRVPGIWTP